MSVICRNPNSEPLGILCTTVLATMAWTIYLLVEPRRTFLKIMMDDGMTKEEAVWEDLRRHGG